MNLQKQLRCVYLHAFTSTLHFTDAVWVALLAARGFTLAQIGLAFSTASACCVRSPAAWPPICWGGGAR